MAEHERLVADAQSKARAHLDAALERVKADAAQQEADLERSLQRRISEADARIAQARDEALRALEDVAVDVSQAAVGRLIGVEVPTDEAAAAVANARREAA